MDKQNVFYPHIRDHAPIEGMQNRQSSNRNGFQNLYIEQRNSKRKSTQCAKHYKQQ
jgi:hypothetical protein